MKEMPSEIKAPVWIAGDKINEVQFCKSFLEQHPMICINDTFFTVNGRVTDENRLRKQILDWIKPYVTVGIPKKINNLLDTMHLCFVPITADGRLSAKEIVGNKKKLTQWQDEYWKHMVKKYPDFERGESASLTGRTHIPPRIFKQAIRLNKQREQLEKLISELNAFNAAKKIPEIKALMAKMLPTAEMLHTYMNRAKATEKEWEAEIAALERAVAAGKVSVLEQLELRQQVQKLTALEQTLLDMQRTMDAIPPEIIASYKAESERKEPIAIE